MGVCSLPAAECTPTRSWMLKISAPRASYPRASEEHRLSWLDGEASSITSIRKTVMLFFLVIHFSSERPPFEPLLRRLLREGLELEAFGDVGSKSESFQVDGSARERPASAASAGAGERTMAPMIRRREREEIRLREVAGRVGEAACRASVATSKCTLDVPGRGASTVAHVEAGKTAGGGPAGSPPQPLAWCNTLSMTSDVYFVAKVMVSSSLRI
mmetsp:Transcript_101460/g.322405  ORF Transcript_101460/g.322405 Transcript_101460/m.322405 type:complete len:215 (+) Transcript_101460:480-1124(+)